MTRRAMLLLGGMLLCAPPAFATIDPPPASGGDPRVRSLVYDPNNPVEIYTAPGMSLRLEFGGDETVVDNGVIVSDQDTMAPDPNYPPPPVQTVATGGAGDSGTGPRRVTSCDANICRAVSGNVVYIKPIRPLDPQPLFIQTTRKDANDKSETVVYAFELFTKPVTDKDGNQTPLIWGVRFTYPNRVKEQAAADYKRKQQAWSAAARDKASMAHPVAYATGPDPRKDNARYGYRGSAAVQPDRAWDDGRSTYLRYNGNRRLPNVYSRLPDGKETTTANAPQPDATGNTIVIAGTGVKWWLRDGDEAGCLFDLGPDPDGRTAATIAGR